MADGARSAHPAVQQQLDRLAMLSPGRDILGLSRVKALMERLGHPEKDLPPVFHVAGTNGKGSTCAFLRGALMAAGYKVHGFTSPHLVRFNERVRLADKLIEDDALAHYLSAVLDVADGISPSFFEVTTAAAFLAYRDVEADALILEVGLGGRLDATNILPAPLVTGIAQLGIDHEAFLGSSLEGIALEKAGIAKTGVPMITARYAPNIQELLENHFAENSVPLHAQGEAWDVVAYQDQLHYRDVSGKLHLPLPRLPGEHQYHNAGLAIAMLRHQQRLDVPEAAIKAAMGWTSWPARLQRINSRSLVEATIESDQPLWLDGGHNPAAGEAISKYFQDSGSGKLTLILGMLSNKDVAGYLAPFADHIAAIYSVPVPDHEYHTPEAIADWGAAHGIATLAAKDVPHALQKITALHATGPVLICGSLYLAGEVLRLNGTLPD